MNFDSKQPCPHCGGSEVFRSHRRGLRERYLLRAVGVRPFRCVNAMPDSIVSTTPTAQLRRILQPPSEPVLQSLEKNLITLSADCHSDIHRCCLIPPRNCETRSTFCGRRTASLRRTRCHQKVSTLFRGIQLDEPDLVIESIREVFESVGRRRPPAAIWENWLGRLDSSQHRRH